MNIIDLFCGAGGLSWGFEKIGMNIICGVDIWNQAINTYQKVHSKALTIEKNIKDINFEETFNSINVDIIVGGPPCQAFSTVGKRALDDERATLVKEFVRAVKEIHPSVFLFENVKGFKSFAQGKLLKDIIEEFNRLGYLLDYATLNAKNFAVPQERERFFILGIDKKLKIQPKLPTRNYILHKHYWTFEEAVSDLPDVRAAEEGVEYISAPQNQLQEFYRQNNPKLTLHYGKKYSQKLLKMMEFIPEGVSAHEILSQIPKEFRPTSGFKNTYKRIRSNKPSPTITRNFTVPSSSNCIHPRLHRALTLREGIRLQSFPDDYPFLGKETHIREMIGNAVPPLMSLGIAIRIASLIGFDSASNRLEDSITNLLHINKLTSFTPQKIFLC